MVLATGAAGLVGWLADVPRLARPVAALSPMSTITAVLLCVASLVISLLASGEARRRPVMAFNLSVLILVLGVWSLASHFAGIPMPTDGLLLDRSLAVALHGSNRMSPASALCFSLFGLAACGAARHSRRATAVSQTAAVAGLLVSLASIVGYLYSVAFLVNFQQFKPIAPQTAAAFLLSFVATFLVQPGRGVARTVFSVEIGGVLARRLLVFVLSLPLLLGGMASACLKLGILDAPGSIFFLTAAADLSLAGLLIFNAFTINRSEVARRRAQRSLVESEQSYRTLFENAADPMFVVDADLRVRDANAAASAVLERPLPSVLGQPLAEIAPACASEMERKVLEAFARGHTSFEACARTPSGHDVPLEVNARAMELRGRRSVLTIARDLSERRRAQRALAEKDSLLRQAQKMEAIGRLAGGIAHDFNNLLTVILGYSEILLGKLAGDERSDAFEIKMCAARAAALTRQLLAFSRRQPATPKPTDMNAALKEMTPLLGRLIGERISLEISAAAGQPTIRIDPTQLEQIVLNLAVNARDAMPEGGSLAIETADRFIDGSSEPFTPAPAEGPYLELSVRDTGGGIPEEVEPHIFEPFFTTKSELQGTGLGLSTVYGIVTQNGGAIRVETSSRGTRMRILFPSVPGAEREDGEQKLSTFETGRKGTLLLVEDDDDVRAYLCLGLRQAGYHLLEASSGEQALQIVERNGSPIDVVVSDVVMPGMGGPGLARELMNRLPSVRILFMSGYDEVQSGIGSLCGRFDLITKPFTLTDLVAKLGEVAPPKPGEASRRPGVLTRTCADTAPLSVAEGGIS
ncbi:MAG TPA: ATP-binding protein [Spirochaetia bacterium]|nr:ATP-binding protein [Spirochaetia bacterium]